MVQIENNEKSEFDFFRYVPQRKSGDAVSMEKKQIIRKKFRMAIARFFRRLKQSRAILHIMNLNKNTNQEENKEAIYKHILN
jgi:hypothetical protein